MLCIAVNRCVLANDSLGANTFQRDFFKQLLCFLTIECDLQAMMAGNLTCSQLVSSYIQVDLALLVCSGKQDEQSVTHRQLCT